MIWYVAGVNGNGPGDRPEAGLADGSEPIGERERAVSAAEAPIVTDDAPDGTKATDTAGVSPQRRLDAIELMAWRAFIQSHATIIRELDAELVAKHGINARDYEVLLYLAQSPDRRLAMSAIAERTMLTRSGITRLIAGLVRSGLIERLACSIDRRVSYAQLTEGGYEKLREAADCQIAGARSYFLAHYSGEELGQLAALLNRLPGSAHGSRPHRRVESAGRASEPFAAPRDPSAPSRDQGDADDSPDNLAALIAARFPSR